MGEGKPGYVEKAKELSPQEANQLIRKTRLAGELAVVAHPVYYDLDDEIEKWIKQ